MTEDEPTIPDWVPNSDTSEKLWALVRQAEATYGLKHGATAFYWQLVDVLEGHISDPAGNSKHD